ALSLGALPYFTVRSLARMFVALVFSISFGLAYGIVTARSVKAERVLMPILDVLQSIPILGFFPAAIYFFIALFQGTPVGVEIAAVFLIFTSMAWNLAFAVYESISTIPQDVRDVSQALGLRGFSLFKNTFLPASVPRLVYDGMLSWAAGWYFLVAAEIITIGSESYVLPGLGRFLAESVYSGHFGNAMIAFGVLVAIIVGIDIAVWRPLEAYATRFKYETAGAAEPSYQGRSYASRVAGVLTRFPVPVGYLAEAGRAVTPTISRGLTVIGRTSEAIHLRLARDRRVRLALVALLFVLLGSVFAQFAGGQVSAVISSLYDFVTDKALTQNLVFIPAAIGYSMLRLTIACVIGLSWTLFITTRIVRSKRLFSILMPLFQTVAAIPPTAYFPFIVALFIGLPAGLELASIVLVLTGMQWYLLFNLVAGAKSLPADIDEAGRAFGLRGWMHIRYVVLPSIYPSLVTGCITAWGGGWNALIVSEYIVFAGTAYSVLGIGAMLDVAAYELGSVPLLVASVLALCATVIILDRLFWKRLYHHATTRYRIE
ncbi:ABC transporter permease subunit, partial [[Eubacterium] cellulosolvens]